MNGELSSNLVYPIPSVPASNYMRILFIGIVIENYCRQKLLNPLWILGLPLIMLGEHHTLNEVFLWQWTNQTFWCHYMPSSFVIQKISKPTQDIECVILYIIVKYYVNALCFDLKQFQAALLQILKVVYQISLAMSYIQSLDI